MFERTIKKVIQDGIAAASADPDWLRQLLGGIDYEDGSDGGNDEIQNLVDAWIDGDEEPTVVLNYPREVSFLPCFAIVLSSEREDQEYLDHNAGFYLPQAREILDRLEPIIGKTQDAKIRRFEVNYSIYVYAENPDVTIAYYNFLKTTMLRADSVLQDACFEDPSYSGADLMAMPQYLPTNVYTRQLTVSGHGHLLYTEDAVLGRLAKGRGKSVERIHVNNRATGVDPGVDPYTES